MMKLFLSTLLPFILYANEIKLSPKEINTWQIQTQLPTSTNKVPLGSFIVEVTIPPTLLQTIALPFDAQVITLNAASYQEVKKGDLLAEVTGTQWIEAQKSAIADAIELRHHTHTAERKNKLCKEEIIPKKECIAANAELKTDKIKVSASKALLESFGASKKMIDTLFSQLKIYPTIPIISKTDGTIITLNAQPGKSTDPSAALFIIKKEGALWLESDMPIKAASILKIGENVILTIEGKQYNSKVLQLSPTLNQQNQTRHVRFSQEDKSDLLAGTRTNAILTLNIEATCVPKKAVIKSEGKHIVFIKQGDVYKNISVDILGEDTKNYYLKNNPLLKAPVVISAVAVLKNMLGGEDE